MKRIRIIGLALLALFALGALAATTASAEEGFLPLKLKGATILAKVTKLEDSLKNVISCKVVTGKGTFTNDSTGTGTLDFDECEVAGFPAFSLGEVEPKTVKEALILAGVSFSICLINSAALTFGIFVTVKEPVHIHVKAISTLITVEGTVIGTIGAITKSLALAGFAGEKGVPAVKECTDEKGGVKKAALTAKTNAEPVATANEKTEGGLLQFEETIELMDK